MHVLYRILFVFAIHLHKKARNLITIIPIFRFSKTVLPDTKGTIKAPPPGSATSKYPSAQT